MSYIPFSVEKECLIGHNQDDIKLSTYSSTGDTQRVKGGNYISVMSLSL